MKPMKVHHGIPTTNNRAQPINARAHSPHVIEKPVILVTKSNANTFGAIAVRNTKDVTFVMK